MVTISLCMIVKNEESCLRACLDSVKDLVDEFILVDTGSTDSTKDIIKEYADTCYTFDWINDFSAARNYAFSLATKDFILWLDADDVLLPKDQEKFSSLKSSLIPQIDIVSMIYDITFNEKGECTLSIPRDKLIRNKKGFYWRYFVHEELVVWGPRMDSDIHVTHTSDHGHYSRYLKNYEQRIAEGYELLPHEKYFYGGELFMAKDYKKCMEVLEDFLKHPSNNAFELQRGMEFLCHCYREQQEYNRGIAYFLSLLSSAPPTSNLCLSLGWMYLESKQYASAIFWYSLVVELSDSLLPRTKANLICANLQLVLCYHAVGRREDAIRANERVLALDKDHPSALFNKKFFES